MPDLDDLEGARLRPNVRPIALALVANVVFGGALLGWPYLRGQARSEDSALAFARFSACLLDADVAERPGVTLPRGERARFATLLVRGPSDWPARCRDELARVSPEPVVMLFPSVKGAELSVQTEVERLDRALAAIDRDSATVPAAPLDALARLQGAIVEQIRIAGVEVDPRRDAIVLREEGDLPTPSIVPTQMAGDRWSIAIEGDALLATSVDARAVGQIRVDGGRVEVRRARRPRLASGVLGAREPPIVIWTTPDAQCEADALGCAQRATGIASLTEDRQRLAPIAWLRAHPRGEVEDAVHVTGESVWIAAVGEGGLAVRRFSLQRAGDAPAQQAAAFDRTIEVGAVDAVRWIDGSPPMLVWAGESAGSLAAREDAEPIAMEPPGGRSRITSAGTAEDGWLVVASERGARVRRADGGATHVIDVAPRPPGRGAVRAVCAGEGCAVVDVLVLRDRELLLSACGPSGCEAPVSIARDVSTFDPIAYRGDVLVAWSGGVASPVHVTRVGDELETSIPAACWSTEDGLCGEPRLAASGDRVVLVTRQGADLRVLESDDGERWHALSGLEQP